MRIREGDEGGKKEERTVEREIRGNNNLHILCAALRCAASAFTIAITYLLTMRH